MQQVLYIVSPIKTHTTALGSIPKYNAGKHRMWCLFDSYCAEENPAVNGHWSKLMWALVKEFKLPRTARLTVAVLSDYLSSRAHNKLARHTTIESQCASITHRYSSIIIIMWTPFTAMISLENDQWNLWNLKTLSLFVVFFALSCERLFIQMDSTESRCVIGLENTLFWGRVCGSFDLETLQAGAVKGLIMNAHLDLPVSTQAIQLHNLHLWLIMFKWNMIRDTVLCFYNNIKVKSIKLLISVKSKVEKTKLRAVHKQHTCMHCQYHTDTCAHRYMQ